MSSTVLRVVGVHGSPYSRKLLASLRYRRLPHVWIVRGGPDDRGLPRPKVELLPQLVTETESGLAVATDSTPILRELDRRHPARRLRPDDPVVALLDAILEDWGDEWLTKPMFHYRWAFDDDIRRASEILPRWSLPSRSDDEARAGGAMFAERQIGRLGVVGSNEVTRPVIEETYRRTLRLLSDHLATSRFVLGSRPGVCDFAIYGQLTQLVSVDPTPSRIALDEAPRVVAWVDVMDDLSGMETPEGGWVGRDEISPTLSALLGEAGRTHAPFLLANAAAIAAGRTQVECTIDGRPWTQKTFPYQAKCLAWLREEHAALSDADRRDADRILAGTGCEALFAG